MDAISSNQVPSRKSKITCRSSGAIGLYKGNLTLSGTRNFVFAKLKPQKRPLDLKKSANQRKADN